MDIATHFKDKEYLQKRVEMAVRNCLRFDIGNQTLWGNVMDILGVGSTHAKSLCEFFQLDPDLKPYSDTKELQEDWDRIHNEKARD